ESAFGLGWFTAIFRNDQAKLPGYFAGRAQGPKMLLGELTDQSAERASGRRFTLYTFALLRRPMLRNRINIRVALLQHLRRELLGHQQREPLTDLRLARWRLEIHGAEHELLSAEAHGPGLRATRLRDYIEVA